MTYTHWASTSTLEPLTLEQQLWKNWNPIIADTAEAVPPLSPTQRLVEELNLESFPFGLFARAHDLVSHCALVCRARSQFTGGAEVYIQHTWPPHSTGQRTIASPEDMICAHDAFMKIMTGGMELTRENASKAVESVLKLPTFSLNEDTPRERWSTWKDILIHVVLRYAILRSHIGPIRKTLVHVMAIGSIQTTYGLMPVRDIAKDTFITELCSSVSSNVIDIDTDYRIETGTELLGQPGSHIIIGPLRLAQHSCHPNTELVAIPNSRAYVLRALVDIPRGSDITVNKHLPPMIHYALDCPCWCQSCTAMQPGDTRNSIIHASVLRPVSDERAVEITLLRSFRHRLKKRREKESRKNRGEPRNKPTRHRKRGQKNKENVDGEALNASGQNGVEVKAYGGTGTLSLVEAYESPEEGEVEEGEI